MTARHATALAAILWTTAFSAAAGPMYQLVGGICTDGTEIGGTLLCSHNITVTVDMVDGYVPGTPFADTSSGPSTVAFFTFSDGFETIATDFPPGGSGTGNFGVMPVSSGLGSLHIHWFDGFFFDSEGGTWSFGIEIGGGGYFSSGTYEAWARVPEPSSFALICVALATLILVRSRRRFPPAQMGLN